MRVAVGRIALLLGIVVVAAMAWYGATALFGDGEPTKDESARRDCQAATKRQARVAERAFLRQHGGARWLRGVGVSDTDRVGRAKPPIEGEGALLLVTYPRGSTVPDLPDCIRDVPVVYGPAGTFGGD
jgi:hypothetical protein